MKFATANPRTQAGRLSIGGEEGGIKQARAGIFLKFEAHWQTKKTLCLRRKVMPPIRRTSR